MRCEKIFLGRAERELNDEDILEICSYLPLLREWAVMCPGTTLSIEGARVWKRINPDLESAHFVGGQEGLSEEVKEVFRGLGVTVLILEISSYRSTFIIRSNTSIWNF
jgi:hypothetical protein